jgi:AraC-like DNA-binding protein
MVPKTRVRSLEGFGDFVRSLGGNPEKVFALAGLKPRDLEDPDGWIPFRSYVKAYEVASEVLNEPAFGVKRWSVVDYGGFGPLQLAVRHADTLLDGMLRMSRYLGNQNTAYRLSLTVDDAVATRSYEMPSDLRRGADQWIEGAISKTPRMYHQVLGQKLPVLRFMLRHKPLREPAAYAREFSAPVLFEQNIDGFAFDQKYLDGPCVNRDAEVQRFITSYLELHLDPADQNLDSVSRTLLQMLIPLDQGRLETVAEHLKLHPRTYQRRLRERGYSFSQLLDDERRSMAEKLLREGNLPLVNVAMHLGFAEQSAFNHAFTAWHGVPPSRWLSERSLAAA